MKKKLFLDTNVVIDFLAKREPFGKDVYALFQEKESLNIDFYISALSFTTIYYVLRKGNTHIQLIELLKNLRLFIQVLPTDDKTVEESLNSEFKDFEDAIQYYTALRSHADVIITRNEKDYFLSEIPVLSPGNYLARK